MANTIFPCLWFDNNAKEAAVFYSTVFGNSKIIVDTSMVVIFEIEGFKIMGLNGGPMFQKNPGISLFVNCRSEEETETVYNKLIEGGMAMMPLNKYPWSEKYGWVKDKFGMSWQIMLGQLTAGAQKITPCFLFTGEQYGKAEKTMGEWTTIFPNSSINTIERYKEGEPQAEGKLKFGHFSLNGYNLTAMDGIGDHQFTFNEGISFVVECDTQEEIDHYWYSLSKNGKESRCGWLKDAAGVSWQIVPKIISSLMSDPVKAPKVMEAVMKMNKLDIETMVNAAK